MAGKTLTQLRASIGSSVHAQGAEVIAAINDAIDSVRTEMFYDAAPIDISQVTSTYEYTITGLDRIHAILTDDLNGNYITTIPDNAWGLIGGGKLKINYTAFEPVTGRTFRLYGQKVQARLSSGSDVLYIDETYVISKAKAILYWARATPDGPNGGTNQAFQGYIALAQAQERIAAEKRLRHGYRPTPGGKKVPGAY